MNLSTVIAAVSTPPGKGGVAIIRMSGEGAVAIADKVFFPKNKKRISDFPPRTQIFGNVVYLGEEIDDGLLCYFNAPSSYTGDETVEISCHGGVLVTRTVLEALFAAGAVPAEPGEFTRRALINGKLTLTDAEAVGDLLEAKTHSQLVLHSEGARTLLSSEIAKIRASLTDTLSSMYARIDYPDEDLGDFSSDELLSRLEKVKESLTKLIASYRTGRSINEGISAVICGKPNAGKSSLYNILLGEDKAIVTDIKGTTRDVLTTDISLGKVLVRLSDTAGIRDFSRDEIELIGIERSRSEIRKSELIFAVFDLSDGYTDEDGEILKELKESEAVKIAVLNKSDKECRFPKEVLNGHFERCIEISAKCAPTDARIELARLVEELFLDGNITPGKSLVIANARQNASLIRACELISSAEASLKSGLFQDIASSDIERALGEIAELDGRAVSDEVLQDIFSKFCVGK